MIVRNVHRAGPMVKGAQCCRDCGRRLPDLHEAGWRIGAYLEMLDDHRVKQWHNPPPARRRCDAEPD
ncbi:MAG: hypothetical protein O7G84_00895 [Gammaproteobacteria bacterium]|nr:hypothetical protein [Gammaproteobacteria bacterium]